MKTQALVLEAQHELTLRDIDLPDTLGPSEVRIAIHTVGICGSDVHYYTHGRIGPFVVDAPMVLGHEASGVVTEIGTAVTTLKPGDRVCMEPGIPDSASRASKLGMYNVDPAVVFWATPAGAWLPDLLGRASCRLHLQTARQCQLRGSRDDRTVRCGTARRRQGAHQAWGSGGGDRCRPDRRGHRARRTRFGLRRGDNCRPGRRKACCRRNISGYPHGERSS